MVDIRRKNEIPFESDTSGFFLPLMVTLMVFLSAITIAGVLSINSMLSDWTKNIEGSLTVQIMPSTIKDEAKAKQKDQEQLEITLKLLKNTKGIVKATALNQEELNDLIIPWIGDSEIIEDLPIPQLIDVKLDDRYDLDIDKLAMTISEQAPLASLDSHRLWLKRLISLGKGIEKLAISILLMVIFATSVTIIYSTRTGIDVHKKIIEILHLMGAKDCYIAQQFGRRNMYLGLCGGIFGLILAIPAIASVAYLVGNIEAGLISEMKLHIADWLLIILIPIFSGLLAMITAYYTVKNTLKRML